MLKRHFWKVAALVVLILVGGSIAYSQYAAKKADEGVTLSAHIKGNPEAKVTLVEYSDFQCPACGQFYPHVKDLMEEFGDSLRFEYRHFPLKNIHPQAVPAARAAEAAGVQGKFWEMHDKLFENQPIWSKGANPGAYFVQYAEEIGIDADVFKRQQGAALINEAIDKSFNDAVSQDFTSTPTFLLNGEKMEFTTFAEFRSKIEEAISATQ